MKFCVNGACHYVNNFIHNNNAFGFTCKTVNLHVELVSDVA
jgi:hypothetical protein